MRPTTEIDVILIRSIYSRNVGYVSRVMANMGAQRMILIDAKCEYDLKARQGAAGAQSHLLQATRYASLTEFYANEPSGLRIAFCSKSKKESDSIDFSDRMAELFQSQTLATQRLQLFFGPEDHGLSNEDVEYAHHIVALPTFGYYASMNLSHAVLSALLIIKQAEKAFRANTDDVKKADPENFYFPKLSIKEWLDTLGFETGGRRVDAYSVLKRILLNNRASAKELRILEAVVNQTSRKLESARREELSGSTSTSK